MGVQRGAGLLGGWWGLFQGEVVDLGRKSEGSTAGFKAFFYF